MSGISALTVLAGNRNLTPFPVVSSDTQEGGTENGGR